MTELPQPSVKYDRANEAETRNLLTRTLAKVFRKGVDIELAQQERLVLHSPDGTRYAVTVANDGTLGTTAA